MEKTMYALTYCFEGTDQTAPYGATIAVSYDKDKLYEEMMRCVEEDCSSPADADDEWSRQYDDSRNFEISSKGIDNIILKHKYIPFLYSAYRITNVDVL